MKYYFSIITIFFCLPLIGQIKKGDVLISGNLKIASYYENENKYKTFEISPNIKSGFFFKDNLVIGVQINNSWKAADIDRNANLTINGVPVYEKGKYNSHYYTLGLFADKYFNLNKNLFITLGLYGNYYSSKAWYSGKNYDINGNDYGSYSGEATSTVVAECGITNSLIYFLTPRLAINCLVSSLDVEFTNIRSATFDLRTPKMVFGLQYHFLKK